MINGKSIFDQTVKNELRTHHNIRKITTGQEDDYRTSCLLDYNYLINTIKRQQWISVN